MDEIDWDEFWAISNKPDDPGPLSGEDVRDALLRHNFFPDQSKDHDEIPPCFTAESFSNSASDRLVALAGKSFGRTGGYDETHYRMTRHDLVPRVANLPHPLAYAQLVQQIADNWAEFAFIETNGLSEVRPQKRSDDARIIIRDGYDGNADDDDEEPLPAGAGKRFLVHADISNFYPSIYSHSIPWALVTKEIAKAKRSNTEYYNRVDACVRATRRGETKGISIGPGTSNIISEVILGSIDRDFSKKFEYTRYIDDYTSYADSESEARQYIFELERELGEIRLSLNPRKTRIDPLPAPTDESWVNQLRLHAPSAGDDSKYLSYMDLAIALGHEYPDGSTIKYAARRVLTSVGDNEVPTWFADQLASLAFYRPVLLPLLRSAYVGHPTTVRRHLDLLTRIAREAAQRGRSDALCWSLYYLGEAEIEIEESLSDEVLGSGDPLALTMLSDLSSDAEAKKVVAFAEGLDSAYPTDLDRYWVLLQTLQRRGSIADPYGDGVFDVLKEEGVKFYVERVPDLWS